jgi:predicted protein tyrosine phosphatase
VTLSAQRERERDERDLEILQRITEDDFTVAQVMRCYRGLSRTYIANLISSALDPDPDTNTKDST